MITRRRRATRRRRRREYDMLMLRVEGLEVLATLAWAPLRYVPPAIEVEREAIPTGEGYR